VSNLKQKQDELEKLRIEVMNLKEEETAKNDYPKVKAWEGTYWKFRNSYSCPGPNDHWYLYRRIDKVTLGSYVSVKSMEFQIDKDGRLDVKEREMPYFDFYNKEWTQTTEEEWREMAQAARSLVSRLFE